MPQKILVIDYEKCTGCRACELACSVFHTGASNPSRSRIRIIKWEEIGLYLPLTCNHCEKPVCVDVCPTKACYISPVTNMVLIDENVCIGCKTCILACPFSSPIFDHYEHISVKCDLCEGDPQCVRFCEVGAIRFIDVEEAGRLKQYQAADKYTEALKMLAGR